MEKQREEQMIYLKDLIFTVLRRWRSVLAVALIIGILLGGAQGISGLRAAKAAGDMTAVEKAMEQYNQQRESCEMRIRTIQENINQHQAYLEDSQLMRLNAYSHYTVTVHLYVETDQQTQTDEERKYPDRAIDVLQAYGTMLLGSFVTETLSADILQTESRYAKEILSVKRLDDAHALILEAKLPTEELAQEVLALVEDRINTSVEQICKDVMEHRAVITVQSVNETVDMELLEEQQDAYKLLDDQRTLLGETKTELANLVAPAVPSGSVKDAVKQAVIWAVIGGIAGVILMVGVLWVAHIGSDKIYAGRNLSNRTGIKVIGLLSAQKKHPVDWLVNRLEGRDAEIREIGTVATDISCRAKDAKCLLVAGCTDAPQREALTKAIASAMPDAKIEDRGSILTSGEALEALSRCDAVVLVEQIGVSSYGTVLKQLGIIGDYEKEILGCVLIEEK